jgi:hypothetical protein
MNFILLDFGDSEKLPEKVYLKIGFLTTVSIYMNYHLLSIYARVPFGRITFFMLLEWIPLEIKQTTNDRRILKLFVQSLIPKEHKFLFFWKNYHLREYFRSEPIGYFQLYLLINNSLFGVEAHLVRFKHPTE